MREVESGEFPEGWGDGSGGSVEAWRMWRLCNRSVLTAKRDYCGASAERI